MDTTNDDGVDGNVEKKTKNIIFEHFLLDFIHFFAVFCVSLRKIFNPFYISYFLFRFLPFANVIFFPQ